MAEKNELKPLEVVAKELLFGKWGETATEIRENLEKAGYNYADVIRWVNYYRR
jgi:hypothetical protein